MRFDGVLNPGVRHTLAMIGHRLCMHHMACQEDHEDHFVPTHLLLRM
jgi:hypothetical protein